MFELLVREHAIPLMYNHHKLEFVYAVYGAGKIARAERIVSWMKAHDYPVAVKSIPNGIAISFCAK